MTSRPTGRRALWSAYASLAALTLLASACDGPNAFGTRVPGGNSGTGPNGDVKAPVVDIQQPRGDSLSAKPLGDSILVRVRTTDASGVDSLVMFGIAHRGDPALGTDTIVQRFVRKKVALAAARKDTTITRYLLATPSNVKETAQIVVLSYDTQGNVGSDTSNLVLGGPDVALQNVTDGQSIQAGLGLAMRVAARDPQGVIQLQLNFSGAFTKTVVKQVNPPSDSIVFDTTVVIPAGVAGGVNVTAVARNSLDVSGQFGPLRLQVISATAGDTVRPVVLTTADASQRMELKDSLRVVVEGRDNAQGSGVGIAGYTVLGIAPSRGDTLIRSGTRNFAPARTGNVSEIFKLPPFNVDSLNLPDTLVFEVTGYLIDAQGNCAASVGGETATSLPCDTLPSGEIVARGRNGIRLTRTIVSGRTVVLPTGGQIMDAVIDTTRRNLYLSNLPGSRVEVFRLEQEKFLSPIPVGSAPWGLSLNRAHDTLLVGNSGGTNISNVFLGPTSGVGPFRESTTRRFLTPDVVLYDIEAAVDDVGRLVYTLHFNSDAEPPGFSDRPQYMAVDSTGRILYSTKTTELGDYGTIRKAYVPNTTDPNVRPEVKLFFEHAALDVAPDFIAIGNVDDIDVIAQDSADEVIIYDHVPGFPNNQISAGPLPIAAAADSIFRLGSDVVWGRGRFNVARLGFSDTTYVTASGDGGWVLFGEGSVEPVGRLIMYEAARDRVSKVVEVADIMDNASETVRGAGLNYDGTLGVARGAQAYFFTTDLRLQGVAPLPQGGAGAAFHPLHADAHSLTNVAGEYRPDTHMAFVGTGEHTIDIIDTFHFFRAGRLFIRDVIQGPLRAVLPLPGDNAGLQCATVAVTDQSGRAIGNAISIFENGDFDTPYPPDGATDDRCIVVKLFGITDTGGVVVVDVRKADILRDHPSRQP